MSYIRHLYIQKSNIMSDISKRQISFFGYKMRKDKLEYLVVSGRIVGKRTLGRRRTLFTDQLGKWTNCSNTIELFRKATKRGLMLPTSFDVALEEEDIFLSFILVLDMLVCPASFRMLNSPWMQCLLKL